MKKRKPGRSIDNELNNSAPDECGQIISVGKKLKAHATVEAMTGLSKVWLGVIVACGVLATAAGFDVLELIFGPRLRARTHQHQDVKRKDEKEYLNDAGFHIKRFGYPFEQHEVTTEDGYILNLHRIPANNRRASKPRAAVLLHHGIFGSSENFMFRGPNKDLCYILSDAGYDVWFSNARGNYHSRKHVKLNPSVDREYWNFSYHEMGYYDLPASVDYILNATSQKSIYYIGYSMGSTVGYIMLSMRPEYNEKIRFMINFAGTGIVDHKLAPQLKIVFGTIPTLVDSLKRQNITELFPRRELMSELLGTICQDRSPLQAICLTIIYLTVGVDYEQFNTTYVPYIFKYYPSGTSINTLLHYYQMFTRGRFAQLDDENASNRTFIDYDLSKITAPVSLHYGDGDVLVTKQDNVAIARHLPNVVGIFRVPFRHFNHLDFIWSSDSKRLLYDQVLLLMEKYR